MKANAASIGLLSVFLLLGQASTNLSNRGDYISLDFYIAGENAETAKDAFRELLDTYRDIPQRNGIRKLDNIPAYLEHAANASSTFASMTENFFNAARNESGKLLLKLRQVPSEETIPDNIKSQLTDYFTEMENFHVILCGILDDTTEFTFDSVQMIKSTFVQYTDVHNYIQADDRCRNQSEEFLSQTLDDMLRCSMGKIRVAFDIFSITKMTTYQVMKRLEHRIQKLYNCFLFGNYPIRCRFVRNAEVDFERLHSRLDELLMYNEKQKRRIYRKRSGFVKCIPENFPESQMSDSLKTCMHSQIVTSPMSAGDY